MGQSDPNGEVNLLVELNLEVWMVNSGSDVAELKDMGLFQRCICVVIHV